MKNDALLKSFEQNGLEVTSSPLQTLRLKANISPLDSGQLISLKGGTQDPPPDPPPEEETFPRIRHVVIGN